MTVKARLISFIKHLKITAAEFERQLGVCKLYVSNIRTSLPPDKLTKLSDLYPELNLTWLMTGKGNMLLSNSSLSDIDITTHLVPLLPIAAQGGALCNFSESIDLSKCAKVISPVCGVDLAMGVAGDSMAPTYPHGSRIFIKKVVDTSFLQWGKVFVLDTQDGSVIKQLKPTSEDTPNKVKCISFNPDYDPFIIDLNKVYGLYKVVARLKFSSL